jgi:ferredoxin
MLRKIIEIDEEKCDGCGLCIPGCPEGALQLIDGKAKLVKDFYCDGLGACIGHCPQGAITVIEREADAYDEQAVMKNIIKQGPAVIEQHLEHLREHGEHDLLREAEQLLDKHKQPAAELMMFHEPKPAACPGSQNMTFASESSDSDTQESIPSSLTHWPVQMHLISPQAPQYQGAELLLAADCVAFAMADFRQKYLKNRKLAIACPNLDQPQDIYLSKLKSLIDDADIKSLKVLIMQVPCCSGLVHLAQQALQQAQRKIPLKAIVIAINGEVLNEAEIT